METDATAGFCRQLEGYGGLLDVYEHNSLQKCTVEEAVNYDYNKSCEGDTIYEGRSKSS
jgi:hypothetical protein